MKEAIHTLRLARQLRDVDPGTLVSNEAATCRRAFARCYGQIPVLICAKDEARDLPATLVSLARTDAKLLPIVIDNGSRDDTAERATHLGATVIEQPDGAKASAFTTGIQHVTGLFGDGCIALSTDADTVAGRHWASAMITATTKVNEASGGMVFGGVLAHRGPSLATDALRTILLNTKQVVNSATDRMVGARGANFGIQITSEIENKIASIPGDTFPGHDRALVEAVISAGGFVSAELNFSAMVATRGDRYESITEYLGAALGLVPATAAYDRDHATKAQARQ